MRLVEYVVYQGRLHCQLLRLSWREENCIIIYDGQWIIKMVKHE